MLAADASRLFGSSPDALDTAASTVKRAADARATKAISRVYSIRSCPDHPARKIVVTCLLVVWWNRSTHPG